MELRRQGVIGAPLTLFWELTATALRAAAGKTKDARAARRMLAIALVLEGVDRATAAQRPRRLVPERLVALAAWVGAAPDPVRDGVVRWRRKDLQHRIVVAFGVTLHERTVGKQLAALGFRRLQVAPPAPEVGSAAMNDIEPVIGALLTIGSVVWSVADKRGR